MFFGGSNTTRQLSAPRLVGQTEFGRATPLCDEALISSVESHFAHEMDNFGGAYFREFSAI